MAVSISHQWNDYTNTSGTTKTFSSKAIGAQADDRLLEIFVISYSGTLVLPTSVKVTPSGSSQKTATLLGSSSSSDNVIRAAKYIVAVPESATTADFEVVYPSSFAAGNICMVSVRRVVGATTPTGSDVLTDNTLSSGEFSVSPTIPTDGAATYDGGLYSGASNNPTISYTNGTEDWESAGGRADYVAGGCVRTTAGATTITQTYTSSSNGGSVCVVYKSRIEGAASITLAALTASAAGTVKIAGAASITLGALTSSATGTVAIKGQAAITLGALTASAAGTVALKGQSSITLADLTSSATGAVAIKAAANITLGDLTASGVGVNSTRGAAAITLADLTVSSAATIKIKGQADITLDALTVTSEGIGTITSEGELSVILDDLTLSSTAQLDITGSLTVTLEDLTSDSAGELLAITSNYVMRLRRRRR